MAWVTGHRNAAPTMLAPPPPSTRARPTPPPYTATAAYQIFLPPATAVGPDAA
ncbi:hypothetical protein GCM10010222_44680 [Streptomyces tanashiensis]|nr:hypothetical protein GCM10010222_44680 [Streptomyces tanashiensis]